MKTGRVVKDFLPRPEALTFKKEQVVTLRLDGPTIAALKDEAHKKGLGVSTLVRMWVRERLSGSV
jgi:predicted DNA binding CopG/RHH family protein